MIELHLILAKGERKPIYINPHQIQAIEEFENATIVTGSSGDKYIVAENKPCIMNLIRMTKVDESGDRERWLRE